MATITTPTYLDNGTARTAGEAWTCNGGVLTIRTDSRWHANAPASLTGSLGSCTISSTLGGGVLIDGTKVRWLEISGGSGTCAVGTTISQGGVSGYFLGYWASMTSAPSTTIGATGYIKLREVTGGTFSAGALSGLSATAVGADTVGWIEVVHDQAATITVPRLGYHRVRGAWFEMGTTTGVAGQVVQFPTMGSATTYATGLWIETDVGTDEYEFYPSIATALMIPANLGTDVRSKFVGMTTTGTVIIGSNGTDTVGYVPPSGCKIKVPNIFVRQCTTAARATNAIPHATITSRPEFLTTSAGVIDHEYVNCDWYYNLSQPSQVRLRYVSNFDTLVISECATALDVYETHNNISASLDLASFALTSNFSGGVIENCRMDRYASGSNDHNVYLQYCDGQTFKNVVGGIVQYARSSGKFQITQSRNITIENCMAINSNLALTTCFDCTIKNYDHVDRYVGTTNSTTAQYGVYVASSCDNIMVDGVTFGMQGQIDNVQPYSAAVYIGQSSNVTVRNIGTREAPLNGGTANQPAYIFYDGGNSNTVRVQRCYMTPTRTGAIYSLNSSKNMLFEHVYGDGTDAHVQACLNATVRNIGGTPTTSGQASVYGTHVSDYFTSDTTGAVLFHFNEPTNETVGYTSSNFSEGSGFTSAGNLSMAVVDDYFTVETPYFVLGHTGIGTNITRTGTNFATNHTDEYQIDTGNGYSAWKNLTTGNLQAETISPSVGFKLKIRLTCTVANSGNLLTYLRIDTTSTLAAQRDSLYPLDNVVITLKNLQPDSRVQLFDLTNNAELYNGTTSGTLNYSAGYVSDFDLRVRVAKLGYMFEEFSDTVTVAGFTRSVTQIVDSVYVINSVDGSLVTSVTIDDTSLLLNINNSSVVYWKDIYAYECFWLTTAEGIRDEGKFITAVDTANYKLENFKIKNVSGHAVVLTGGWAVDAVTNQSIDLIDTTGGTIFSAPDHVVAYATGGSALTTLEHDKLMSVATKGDIWASAVLGVN